MNTDRQPMRDGLGATTRVKLYGTSQNTTVCEKCADRYINTGVAMWRVQHGRCSCCGAYSEGGK